MTFGWRAVVRVWIAGVLICLIAGSLGGTLAAAKDPTSVAALGETNVITGNDIAGMRVRIPKTVNIPEDPSENPAISYEGAGRVVGFVLVEDRRPLRKAYQLISTRWDFCGSPGCTGHWRTSFTHGVNWRGRHGFRIPAGNYHLYLIADQTPARVVLHLEGLSGEVSLRPTMDVTARIASPTEEMSSPSSHLFLGRARPMRMPSYGLLIDGDGQEYGPGAHADGSCYWRMEEGEDEEPWHATPGPHCLSFTERGGFGWGSCSLPCESRSLGSGPVRAGDWRSSYWSTRASPSGSSEFLALWLAYKVPH